MTKKWMALSVLLLIAAGLLGWGLRASIRNFNADNDLEKLQPSREKDAEEKSLPQLPSTKIYIPEEFAVIPETNLFSESRSMEEEEEDSAPVEAQPLLQKPVLVGINIMDTRKTVLLVDPKGSSQGGNRRAEIKRIGDVFQGHTITEIAPDHIVLESGSRKEIIPLHEGSKQTPGGRTPILSTRVVSFDGGAASGGTPIVAAASKVSSARTVDAPKSAPAAAQPQAAVVLTPVSQASPQSPAATQSRPQSPARTQQPQGVRSQQASPNTGSSAPNTRVIRTPFGDIVRPVRD